MLRPASGLDPVTVVTDRETVGRRGLDRARCGWRKILISLVMLVCLETRAGAQATRPGSEVGGSKTQDLGRPVVSDGLFLETLDLRVLRDAQERHHLKQPPRTRGFLPAPTRGRLESAFRVALAMVEASPRCQSLFSSLGTRGEDALHRAVFFAGQGTRPCDQGVPAFNYFGHPLTGLCPAFERLDIAEASVQLIHEALHVAGMNEYPNDPAGLTPHAITALVKQSCLR